MPSEVEVLAPEAPANAFTKMNDVDFAKHLGIDLTEPAGEPEVKPAVEVKPDAEVKETPKAILLDEADQPVKSEPVKEEKPADEPVVEEKPKRVFDFQVFDPEGELEVPEHLTFKYTANGKTQEVPLEKVVKLAQMGHYNHEREQKLQNQEREAQAALAKAQQSDAAIVKVMRGLKEMLADPSKYEAAREQLAAFNSPEARAERLENELQAERQQAALQRETATVAGYIQGTLVPTVTNLLAENPTVTEYELMGRYSELTQPLMVNGRMPAQYLPYLDSLVKNDLANWVRGQHFNRQEQGKEKEKSLEEAKQKEAKLKRQLSRAVAPAGGPAPDVKPAVKVETAKDWLKDFGGVLSSV